MIRRTSLLLLLCGLLLAACTALDEANPYEGVLGRLTVRLRYPGEHASWCREGVEVTATDRQSGNRYTARTDAQGEASFRMPNGLYALAVSDRADSQTLFNGAVEQLRLTAGGEAVAELELRCVRPGGIVIREIYTGGCPATPATGSYVYDKYVILHNNDSETRYLDGLCLGMVDPYNSKGASGNYWTSLAPDGGILFRDYASVPDAVWQFPGSGRDFPLAPGADAVVALNGAVDHTATYPLSVNLNGEGYFVCYNETYYPDTRSHPVPGDRIDPARQKEAHRAQIAALGLFEQGVLHAGQCRLRAYAEGLLDARVLRTPAPEGARRHTNLFADLCLRQTVHSQPLQSQQATGAVPLADLGFSCQGFTSV